MSPGTKAGKSASTSGPTAAREPEIRSWNTRAVLLELDLRAIPAEKLLARHGFTRAELEDPEGWVPLRRHNAFFGAAVEASGDPALGFAVGAKIPYQTTGVVGHLLMHSKDAREAWETWSRFSELVVDDTEFGVHSTPEFDAIFFQASPGAPLAAPGRNVLRRLRHGRVEGDDRSAGPHRVAATRSRPSVQGPPREGLRRAHPLRRRPVRASPSPGNTRQAAAIRLREHARDLRGGGRAGAGEAKGQESGRPCSRGHPEHRARAAAHRS